MVAPHKTEIVTEKKFPTTTKVVVHGKSGVVLRDDNIDKRYVKFDRPGSMEKNPRWIPITELSADDTPAYFKVVIDEPGVEAGSATGVPIPPRPDAAPLPDLPEADPDADTTPVEIPQPLDELQTLREENQTMRRDLAEATRLIAESIEAMRQVKRERDTLLEERDSLAQRNGELLSHPQPVQPVATPPAPKLHREYRIEVMADEGALEDLYANGWTIETMQFTPDGKYPSLNIVAWRSVPEPVSPPQPEQRASIPAILTADFVRESIQDATTEIDEAHEPEPVLHLNKQPDSRQRTDVLYQRRKALLGKGKAGSFIARQNTFQKRQRETLAQRLAAAGLPIAAQLAESGLDETREILNAQVYAKAKAAFDTSAASFQTVPLLSGGSL